MGLPPLNIQPQKPQGSIKVHVFIEEWHEYPNGQWYFKKKVPGKGHYYTPKKNIPKGKLEIKGKKKEEIL